MPSLRRHFRLTEIHYRSGLAFQQLAQSSNDAEDREENFRQARHHFAKMVEEDALDWRGYFKLAHVQVDLRMYELARQNNAKALEILPAYAPAKYNLAICKVKVGKLEEALSDIRSITAQDTGVQGVIRASLTDEELGSIATDAREHLRSLDSAAPRTRSRSRGPDR